MTLRNSGGGGVTSVNDLLGDVGLIQGPGVLIRNDPIANGIELSATDPSIDFNDVLTNGNKTTRSAQFLTKPTDTQPSLVLASSGISFGSGSGVPTTSMFCNNDASGSGGLVVNTPHIALADATPHVLATTITIAADEPVGSNATNIILSEDSTIHCSNLTSSGGINPVAVTAANGLTTPSLAI